MNEETREAMETPSETPADERLDNEFSYVIGRVTERDVRAQGQMVVPANTQVTAAEAAAALAAGVLEDLAFAVGMGDPSKTDVHAMPDEVEGTTDPIATNVMADPDATIPASGALVEPPPNP